MALKLKRKSINVGNITSIMGYYRMNGYINDTAPAKYITYDDAMCATGFANT